MMQITEAEGDSVPCRFGEAEEVEDEVEEKQLEQALLAVAEDDAEGLAAKEGQ